MIKGNAFMKEKNGQEEYKSAEFPEVIDVYEVIDEDHQKPTSVGKAALVPFDPLRRYLIEISKYSILTRQEEEHFARKFREEGDPKAAYILVVSNLRLVVKIAMEYQRSWVTNIMDLIQEGNLGLIQAVKKFDPFKNIKLSYYASFWIKAYILKYILDNWRLVKIGTTQAQRKLFFNLQKEKARLSARGFKPSARYLAEVLDVREQDIIEMNERLALPEKSLDYPSHEDYNEPIRDTIPARNTPVDERLADHEARERFHEKLGEFRQTLSGKELDIFNSRLMAEEPETLQQIGERYGITRERTRQLETKVVDKLRAYLQKDGEELSDYQVSDIGD